MRKLATLLSLVLTVAVSAQSGPPQITKLMGKKLPEFSMVTSTGSKLTKKSLKGKVILLDFWASWCGPCMVASPVMNDLHKKYSAKGLVVIGANLGESPRDGNVAAAYKKQHGYAYTFTKGNDKYSMALGVTSLPTFILVNRKGMVEQIFAGWHPTEVGGALETRIKQLLKIK
ncbi:MAG: TlpA disulfide reductase family protein [Fimbriimonadaceae bacterium]